MKKEICREPCSLSSALGHCLPEGVSGAEPGVSSLLLSTKISRELFQGSRWFLSKDWLALSLGSVTGIVTEVSE